MAKTVIRPAAEEDIPAIIALYRQLDSAMVALQPEFFCEAPREVDEIRKAVRGDDADFLLAEQDGTAVGFALVYYAGWTPAFSCVLPHRYACLGDLIVDAGVREQGIGSQLLAAAKRWARNRRLEYLELLQQIHTLEEPGREVLYLRLFGQLSFREIGEVLHKSENWARVTFYRGKEKLKKELKRND